MPQESEIQFEAALRDFIKNCFPKIDVEPPAILILSKLLKGFNNEFIKGMLTYKSIPLLNAAQCAVEKTLPNNLKKLALAEAHRQLALFEMGSSEYDEIKAVVKEFKKSIKTIAPKKSSVRPKKKSKRKTGSKKSKKQIGSKVSKKIKKIKKRTVKKERGDGGENFYSEQPTSVFKVGIDRLHGLTHSTLKIEKDALGYLSACLYYFSKTMASKLSEKYPNTEIEPKNIKDILADFSGPDLHQTAISEGIKSVTLFMNGLLQFKVDSSKREPPIKGESFRCGIELFLEKEFFEPIRLDIESSEYLEHLLMEFLNLFATDAGDICMRHKVRIMTDKEVKLATEDILAEELRRHAMVRGEKAVTDFLRGLRQYTQPNVTCVGMVPKAISEKKNSLLNPKPKKRPKLDATAKQKATPSKLQASKSSNNNPKRKKAKPSKKIKSLVSKVLKKK